MDLQQASRDLYSAVEEFLEFEIDEFTFKWFLDLKETLNEVNRSKVYEE